MDGGISSVASVIAVVQLTGSIVKICGGYIQEVKDAQDEILSLQRQVARLTGILEKLSDQLQGSNGTKLSTSQTLGSNIPDCRSVLDDLEKKIDPE